MGMLMRYHYETAQKPEIKAEEPKKVEIPVEEEKPVKKATKAVRKPTTRKKK